MGQILKKKLVILAALAGLATSFFVYNYLIKVANAGSDAVLVVTAKRVIPIGSIIEPAMLEMQKMEKNAVPGNAIGNTMIASGKIARRNISAGAPVLTSDIEPKNRLSHVVPRYMRAVTVPLDPARSVIGFLKPGDHVDVVVTFDSDGTTVAKTIIQDVELLASGGQVLGEDQSPAGNLRAGEMPTATMSLTPSDAEKLILAESKGKISLALRRLDDSSVVVTRGVTGQAILGKSLTPKPQVQVQTVQANTPPMQAAQPKPAVAPAQPPVPKAVPVPAVPATKKANQKTVTVVRGTKVEEVAIPK